MSGYNVFRAGNPSHIHVCTPALFRALRCARGRSQWALPLPAGAQRVLFAMDGYGGYATYARCGAGPFARMGVTSGPALGRRRLSSAPAFFVPPAARGLPLTGAEPRLLLVNCGYIVPYQGLGGRRSAFTCIRQLLTFSGPFFVPSLRHARIQRRGGGG